MYCTAVHILDRTGTCGALLPNDHSTYEGWMPSTMSCHTVTHNTPGGPLGDGGLTGPTSGEGTSGVTGPCTMSVDPKEFNTIRMS